MKTHYLFLSFLLSLITLCGCKFSGSGLPQGTGWPYEAVVVMKQSLWNNETGKALRGELESDIPGLPQSESALKLTKVTPEQFDGLLRYAKNIMIVNVDASLYTKVSLKHESNLWAQNQVVLTMNAPDEESVIQYLKERQGVVVNYFTMAEMNRALQNLEKTYNLTVEEKLQTQFGIKLNVPTEMTYYRDTTDFFWTSNNDNTGRTDIIVYSFPYTDPETFTVNYLVNKRDSVLRENLPGAFPNSYMTTEIVQANVEYKPIAHFGKYAGVMRGLWKMMGDMMGGPFVSLVKVDEANNRIIVVESFVFAPGANKRNLIRRGEAIVYTLRLSDEFNLPVSEALINKSNIANNTIDGK